MSNKIKISDELNGKLDSYIKTHNLGRRSKGIVAEYAVKSFLEEWNVDPEDWVPVDLLKKIIDAQVAANKKISEALKKKKEQKEQKENFKEFKKMTAYINGMLENPEEKPYVQKFPFTRR